MGTSKKHGLVAFVDATPSEQVGPDPDELLCLTGVFAAGPSRVPGLKQYKDYRWRDRSQQAKDLAKALKAGEPWVLACGAAAKMNGVERYGRRVLKELEGKGVTRDGTSYLVDGCRLSPKIAAAAGWYAAALATIAASAARWAEEQHQERLTLFVDRFPGVPVAAMKLLTHLITKGEVREGWEAVRPLLKVRSIYVDTLDSYVDDGGTPRDGKGHPDAVLADWLSHSLYAQQNPAAILDHVGRPEAYKQEIAAPWAILENLQQAKAGTLDEWISED